MAVEKERKAITFKFRFFIQYEKVLDDGSFSLPFTVSAQDISREAITFYANEKMTMHSKLRISFELGEEKVSFIGRTIKAERAHGELSNFLIEVEIEKINEKSKQNINEYLDRINIYDVLSSIDLEDVADIHFVTGYPPILKKKGKLVILKGEPFGENILKGLLFNILDDDRYKKFIQEKEMNLVFLYKEGIRFRVNLHIQRDKVEGVFRLIPTEIQLPQQLGLPLVVERLMIENKKGLILVAGRTGSGKTTTLASMVELLNNRRVNLVICIENPIEYIHTNQTCIIKQREVGKDTLSFSSAAKNALRQSPDVIVIGEILDRETMEVAIAAAETGILVLTSIHAADSSQALDRVSSFFPPETQKHMLIRLSLVLKGVITQNLVPRKDGKGLVVATEVLVTNNAMRRAVKDGDWGQILTIIQTGKSMGMQSMRSSLQQYLSKELIDEEYIQESTA